jgi:nicotinate-nucleotide adenylyltransferase
LSERDKHLRLGILGGTFDPIHIAHLRIAEEVLEGLELDKVCFIPGAMPPHKTRQRISPFEDRLAMTRMAVKDTPFFEVLDLEGRRKGPSYSVQTLREIHLMYGEKLELFFIIGMDAFQEIKTWWEYRNLFDYANFVLINRPGFSIKDLESFIYSLDASLDKKKDADGFISPSGNRLFCNEVSMLDISSTNIKKMVSTGKSIRFLVPEPIRVYIQEKGLYKNHERY